MNNKDITVVNETKYIVFDLLSTKHIIILTFLFILMIVGLWQAYLPFLAERHFREGYNFQVAERHKFAIEELELAVKYAPWDTHYRVLLGKEYENYADTFDGKEKMKWLEKAKQVYIKIIKMDPLNPWFRNRLASIYIQFAKIDKEKRSTYLALAEKATVMASKLDSHNPIFQLSLAYFYHRYGKFDIAEKYYLHTLELDKDMYEVYFNLADIYRRRGLIDKQLDAYMKIYNKKPDFQNVAFLIAKIYIVNKHDDAKGMKFLEKAIKYSPNDLKSLRFLGSVYQRLGKLNKAISLYEKVLMRYPEDNNVRRNYVKALFDIGNYKLAKEELDLYLDINPNDKGMLALKRLINRK